MHLIDVRNNMTAFNAQFKSIRRNGHLKLLEKPGKLSHSTSITTSSRSFALSLSLSKNPQSSNSPKPKVHRISANTCSMSNSCRQNWSSKSSINLTHYYKRLRWPSKLIMASIVTYWTISYSRSISLLTMWKKTMMCKRYRWIKSKSISLQL